MRTDETTGLTLTADRARALQDALLAWGEAAQKMMLVEEVGELLSALAKFERGRVNRGDVIDEIADVQIILWQMALMQPGREVEYAINRKMERLAERVKLAREGKRGHP